MEKIPANSAEHRLLSIILAYGEAGFKASIESIEVQASTQNNILRGRFSSRGQVYYFKITRGKDSEWETIWGQTNAF